MNITNCIDCKHFRRHYVYNEKFKIFTLCNCGHCTINNRYRIKQNCENHEKVEQDNVDFIDIYNEIKKSTINILANFENLKKLLQKF